MGAMKVVVAETEFRFLYDPVNSVGPPPLPLWREGDFLTGLMVFAQGLDQLRSGPFIGAVPSGARLERPGDAEGAEQEELAAHLIARLQGERPTDAEHAIGNRFGLPTFDGSFQEASPRKDGGSSLEPPAHLRQGKWMAAIAHPAATEINPSDLAPMNACDSFCPLEPRVLGKGQTHPVTPLHLGSKTEAACGP